MEILFILPFFHFIELPSVNLRKNTAKTLVSNPLKRCENERAYLMSTCYKCANTLKKKLQWGRKRYVTMSVVRGEGGGRGNYNNGVKKSQTNLDHRFTKKHWFVLNCSLFRMIPNWISKSPFSKRKQRVYFLQNSTNWDVWCLEWLLDARCHVMTWQLLWILLPWWCYWKQWLLYNFSSSMYHKVLRPNSIK